MAPQSPEVPGLCDPASYRRRLFASDQIRREELARKPFHEKLAVAGIVATTLLDESLATPVLRVIDFVREAFNAGVVVTEPVVTGGMAVIYHSEPVNTVDLDLLCYLPTRGVLLDLEPVYRFFLARGATMLKEHLVYRGLRFQLIPPEGPLEEESLHTAIHANEQGIPFRVVDMEYLIALKLKTGRERDKSHLSVLLNAPRRPVRQDRLHDILTRHNLLPAWTRWRRTFD